MKIIVMIIIKTAGIAIIMMMIIHDVISNGAISDKDSANSYQ